MSPVRDLELRTIIKEEYYDWFRDHESAFGRRSTKTQAGRMLPALEMDRALAVFDGNAIVGTAHAHSVELTHPGGSSPSALVDMVGVVPTHRRRGLLTQMMMCQLADFHQRGESLAALTASESVIYQRFGYGIGSLQEDWSIGREYSALTSLFQPDGYIRFVSGTEAKTSVLEVYHKVTSQRPGMVRYQPESYDKFLYDSSHTTDDPPVFRVVYQGSDGPLGYARYQVNGDVLVVQELMAVTPASWAGLWHFCLSMDLMTGTEAVRRPVDDPLLWMLADPRRVKRDIKDRMWLRIVDVRGALERRRYSVDGKLVIQVEDKFCPWNEGIYDLEGSDAGAFCRATNSSPDLTVSASDLASAYLGAVGFRTLFQAGRVSEHTDGAITIADSMFRTMLAPWAPYNL